MTARGRAQWQDLTDKQKKQYGGNKKAFKAAKKQTARSGGNAQSAKAIVQTYKAPAPKPSPSPAPRPAPRPTPTPTPTPSAPAVSDINKFDRTAGGAGSSKGTDRLSSADLKNLESQGHSLDSIIKYAEKSYAKGAKGGEAESKSGKTLAAMRARLAEQNKPQPAPTPAPTPAPSPQPTPNYDFKPKEPTNPGTFLDKKRQGVIDQSKNTGGQNVGTGDKIASNTGDIDIAGDNQGIANTGVIDQSTNIATSGARPAAQKFKDGKMMSDVVQENKSLVNYEPPKINQNVGSGDKIAENTGDASVGGSNYGTVNTGVMDYSVNIGAAGGSGSGSLNNMQSSAAYNALNENQYERSKSKVSAPQIAARASAMAEEQVGGSDRVKGLNDAVNYGIDYWKNVSQKAQLGLFGDIWNMRSPTWNSPAAPNKIEPDYDD